MHLSAGLSVGLTGLAAGYAIGVVGDMVHDVHFEEMLCETDKARACGRTCNSLGYSLAWF